MRKNIFSSLIMLMILIGAGCRAKKETAAAGTAASAANSSKKSKLSAIASARTNYNTVSIRSKADLDIGGSVNDVSMNIRMKKDQIIWVSITAIAGLEVARALITPDSVKVINRLQAEYTAKPFSYIHQFTNNQINFNTVQSILIGNAVQEFVNDRSDISMQAGKTILSGMLENLGYSVQLNERNKVLQTSLKDENAGQSLLVNYADFTAVASREVPHSVDIQSEAGRKSVNIDLKYSKVTFDESLEFSFNVPKRYTVKN